jgi:carbamoyl-phosphate synthase large subunit
LARVVAADADPTAAGLHLADRGAVVPLGSSPEFVGTICRLARASGATILVCTVVEELLALGAAVDELTDAGLRCWLPSAGAVESCTDKWKFARMCADIGAPHPATALGHAPECDPPWIVKPRRGRGSRDTYLVHDASELHVFLDRVDDPLVQAVLPGREFTIDVLIARDGTLAGASPRWRVETRGGISTKGVTFASPRLVEAMAALVTAAGLDGPACVQGFADGHQFAFTEINPRFSGGLALTLAAGCDLVGEYVRGVAGQPLRPERLVARPNVAMTRYFCEAFSG